MKIVSELREAMWGVVQMAISSLDVDFTTYAPDRGEHAIALAHQSDLEEQLRTGQALQRREDLGPHLFVARIEEWFGANFGTDVATEYANAHPRSRHDQLSREIRVGDRRLEAVAVATARDAPEWSTLEAHGL